MGHSVITYHAVDVYMYYLPLQRDCSAILITEFKVRRYYHVVLLLHRSN